MKYDDLLGFKKYIYAQIPNRNTARKYYSAVIKLYKNVPVGVDIKKLNLEFYQENIRSLFRTRNEVSAAKNGLKFFKEYIRSKKAVSEKLPFPEEDFYKEICQHKRNYSVKPRKELYLDEIRRKINQIQDEKEKYAFRLSMVSGLRVSELAGLDADKLQFDNGVIYVEVTNGKGGSNGVVECLPDKYLYERLQQYVTENPEGRLFYSSATLRKKAHDLNLECHDFRRIYAQLKKREALERGVSLKEANEEVRIGLRHKRFSTTKRYLFNRKLVVKKTKGKRNSEK